MSFNIVATSQASRTDAERTLQRDREEHQRAQEKHIFESSNQRDTIQSLSQKLSKAEARANSLENECHRNALTVAEKGVILETLAREKDQSLAKLKDLEAAVLREQEQASRAGAKQEAMQERLAQAQSENALLRQQLEEALNKGSAKDKAVTDVHQNFAEMLNQLRADGEERVHLVEERSKELARTNNELREQNYKIEQEKAEREVRGHRDFLVFFFFFRNGCITALTVSEPHPVVSLKCLYINTYTQTQICMSIYCFNKTFFFFYKYTRNI